MISTACPKPKRRIAKSPTPIARTAVKKRNAKRARENRLRAYGPPERRRWVKAQPCIICRWVPSENAHIESGGKGRKADADKIVPLCWMHHRMGLHKYGRDWFEQTYDINLKTAAAETEKLWQLYLGSR